MLWTSTHRDPAATSTITVHPSAYPLAPTPLTESRSQGRVAHLQCVELITTSSQRSSKPICVAGAGTYTNNIGQTLCSHAGLDIAVKVAKCTGCLAVTGVAFCLVSTFFSWSYPLAQLTWLRTCHHPHQNRPSSCATATSSAASRGFLFGVNSPFPSYRASLSSLPLVYVLCASTCCLYNVLITASGT